jgi:hypothetical protein
MGYGHAARDGVRNTFTYLEDILFLSDYWRVERDVLLAYLLCTCLGLKNSRKGKPYFTIKLQKFAYQVRGKGLERNQILKCISTRSRVCPERVLIYSN